MAQPADQTELTGASAAATAKANTDTTPSIPAPPPLPTLHILTSDATPEPSRGPVQGDTTQTTTNGTALGRAHSNVLSSIDDDRVSSFLSELSDDVVASVVDRLVLECAFDVHREAKLGFLQESPRPNQDIFGNTKSSVNKLFCQCPVCHRSVGAARFAPHLDKCIQRSTRVKPSRYRDILAEQQPGKRISATSRLGAAKRGKVAGKRSAQAETPMVHTVSNARVACWVCKTVVKGDDIFICFGCDRANHVRCVNLNKTTRRSPTFFCRLCSEDIVEEVNAKNKDGETVGADNFVQSWLDTSRRHLEKGGGVAPLLPLEFYCDSCDKVIPAGAHRWRCLECKNYDNCEACLQSGIEKEQHKSSHHRIKMVVRKPQ